MNPPDSFNPAHAVLQHFAQLMAYDLSLAEFEQWVYSSPYIADVIGYDQYFQLLDVEYRLPSALDEVRRLITQLADQFFPDELEREQVRLVLCAFVQGALNVFNACAELAWRRSHGAEWIPIIFVGIDSELDSAPDPAQYHRWEAAALAARLAEVEQWVTGYHALALAEARSLLAAEFPDRPCAEASPGLV
jgi:hypothetical protein